MLTGGSGRNSTLGVIEDLRRNIHPEARDPDSSADSWQLGDARHLSRQRINQRELGLRHVLRQARSRAVGFRWFLPLLCVESSLLLSASQAYKQPKRHMILKDFVAFNVFVVSLGKKC